MKQCHQALLSVIFVLQRKGSETESTSFCTERTNLTVFEVSFRDNFFFRIAYFGLVARSILTFPSVCWDVLGQWIFGCLAPADGVFAALLTSCRRSELCHLVTVF